MRIQAAVTEAQGAPFAVQPLELEAPREDEILVEVAAAGICHTDLIVRDQLYPVPLPAVLGHEGAGVVRAVGASVRAVAPGDHVAMSYDSCGICPTCAVGRRSYCHEFGARNFEAARADGSTALARDGEPIHSHFFGQSSFATHAIATERNVVKLDPDLPPEVMAPLGCGIQTGAGAVMNVLRPQAGTTLAVFGTGTVGLAAVMAARLVGATTVIGVDTNAGRLELARELGATHAVDASREDAGEAIARITGHGVDFALETTAVPAVLRTAHEATAPTGTTGVIGAPAYGTEVVLDINSILTAGRTVRGIVEGDSIPAIFIPRLIALWREGRFPVDRLITTYDFDRIDAAAGDAEGGRVVKAVVRM